MRELNPTHIKALFDQLVAAVGTQDAAAVFLGISRQRVGQLISTTNNDLPTVMQIAKLEQVCGQSLVFGTLAREVEGDPAADTLAAAVLSTAASSAALTAIHAAKADGIIDPLEDEAIKDRARENLEAAQRQYDAAMNIRPTLRVVA
ncbi:hypothetical protein [Brevundimonas sp.]|uniref:hypothetical protein n=1 Tax=Brevundimonas sp. TaxID=1871086 RepID=UPI002ED90801